MGFNAKKAAKSTDKALAGLDSQIKAGNAARTAQADADMADIRKDMAAKTAARVASKAAPQKQSFAEAFRAARAKAKAEGRDPSKEVFTWGGQKKVARLVGEGASKPAARPVAKSGKAAPAARPAAKQEDKPITVTASRDQVAKAKQQAPAQAEQPKRTYSSAESRQRAGRMIGSAVSAPFKAFANYNPLSLAARAIFDGKPAKAEAPRQRTSLEAERKADYMRRSQAERAAGRQGNADFYEREAGRLKKGGAAKKPAAKQPVKKFAKGGSVDGCAIRGKTRAPLRKK